MGFSPNLDSELIFAPYFNKNITILISPHIIAQCKGVYPEKFLILIQSGLSIKQENNFSYFFLFISYKINAKV